MKKYSPVDHQFMGDTNILFTDPPSFEEESTSPTAPTAGAKMFTRAGKMWVRTPTVEYALGVDTPAVSLLVNGDFESSVGGPGTQPIGWNGFWHGGSATLAVDNTQVATGLLSAKCHLNAASDENVVVQTSNPFPITGGGVLLLEFNARSGAQAGGQIEISIQTSVDNTGDAPNFFVPGTFVTGAGTVIPVNGWTHYNVQFPIIAGHTLARLCLRVGKNTAVVDANTTQQDVWIDSCVARMDTSASSQQTLEWRSLTNVSGAALPAGNNILPFKTDQGGTGITVDTLGRMVIVTPGVYHAFASVEFNSSANTYLDIYLIQRRGGTNISQRNTVESTSSTASWTSGAMGGDFQCLAGDTFEVVGAPGSAGVINVEVNRSQFVMHKLAGPGPIGPAGEKGETGYSDMAVNYVYFGADFNPASAAPSVPDGFTVAVGDRVLKVTSGGVGVQTDGVYTVTTVGTGSNGVWTRATDADTTTEIGAANVKVARGTIWGGTRWSNSLKTNDVFSTKVPHWACFTGDTGWIDVPFAAGISQYPSNDRCQYRRLNGVVYTKGLAILTGSAGTLLIFTYPPGFRPQAAQGPTHTVTAMQGQWGIVNQWSDGRLTHNTGPVGWCSLHIAPFPADN